MFTHSPRLRHEKHMSLSMDLPTELKEETICKATEIKVERFSGDCGMEENQVGSLEVHE